jgi:hypothetical protein
MGEKGKNHAQLMDEENARPESILVKMTKEIQKTLDKNSDPKKFAEKALKSYDSVITRATNYLMLSSLSINAGIRLSPKQIKEMLPDNIKINSGQLTRVLKKLEREGIFTGIERSLKHRGRHRANENIFYNRDGGRPSYYTLTEGLEELRKIMSYSSAAQLVHDRLKREGIIQEYYKFYLLAGFYAMRIEGKGNGKLFEDVKSTASSYISQISEGDFSFWESYVDLILSKNENELNLLAERMVECMAENNPFNYFVYLLKILQEWQLTK